MASILNSYEISKVFMHFIYLFLTKNNASKTPSMEAITFLYICMKLGYLWFHTLA